MSSGKPKVIMFDLDGTLSLSKQPVTSKMADALAKLSSHLPVGIVSGATFERIQTQAVSALPVNSYKNIFLCPTSGASLHIYDQEAWRTVFNSAISEDEAGRIIELIERVAEQSGLLANAPAWGPRIEFRGSQVTFSALGQNAPLEAKAKWDKDKNKRLHLREMLAPSLPDYDIGLGGTTSIDIVKKGINKAYAVTKAAERFQVKIEEILYVGDDLEEGGNDYVVAANTKATTHPVTDPEETLVLIEKMLKNF